MKSWLAAFLVLSAIAVAGSAQNDPPATQTTPATTTGTTGTTTTVVTTATAGAAGAQAPSGAAAPKEAPIDKKTAEIEEARSPKKDDPKNKVARLGDVVIVRVKNDDVFRKSAGTNKITLFLNGQDTELEPIDGATADYSFRLERTEKNKDLWARVLEAPFTERESDIHVSVGYAGQPLPASNDAGAMRLKKMEFSVAAWIWVGILIAVLFYFRHLVHSTDILRNGPAVGGQKQAYSLGRSQMAWWLFIVIVSYVTIWMISGNRDTVSTSTLILIGISGATALGAVMIDATASTRIKAAIDRLDTELTTLQAQLAAPGVTSALTTALNQRIAAIQQEKANIVTSPATVGWLTDVLTDDNGAVALHRLQVLLWTFVLGVIFLASVAHVLSMPEFNATLLALMGISSTTYLGFKMPTNS